MTISALERHPSRTERRRETSRLFALLAEETDETRRKDLIDQVIVANLGVAQSVARRFRGRGLSDDDLDQVAYMALTRAAQKFDVSQDRDFLTYAVPTISGELKRHFRDLGWTIRPPRRIQEIQSRVIHAYRAGHEAGRPPSETKIAAELDLPVDQVREALRADGCFHPTSLDLRIGEDDSGERALGDTLATDDDAELAALEARAMLGPALATLSPRDRHILYLRFVEEKTQREIGEDLGVTQMQASRLLKRILGDLRGRLSEEPDVA
jgi:RNA polymerase sigma-B factor